MDKIFPPDFHHEFSALVRQYLCDKCGETKARLLMSTPLCELQKPGHEEDRETIFEAHVHAIKTIDSDGKGL